MGNADFWYAADIAVAEEPEKLWSWGSRLRSRRGLEAEIFTGKTRTHAFFLTAQQRDSYSQHYHLASSRSSILPIVVHRKRVAAAARYKRKSVAIRRVLGIPAECVVTIAICLNAKLKGVDRTLAALVQFPEIHFVVVGTTDRWIRRRANFLGIGHRVHLIPYRSEIMPLLSAADFMIHPARLEAAGQVIVEALLAGTPAIVSKVCGYASEIERHRAGIVLPEPFAPNDLVTAIASLTDSLDAAKGYARRASDKIAQAADDWLLHIAECIERHSPPLAADTYTESASME
jgi:UDP-glucose:(heptosyl)LPS alpha-1,3-glucosyltransferase